MPRDLVKSDRYPPYFSGAGYVMTANVAFRLAEAKKELPITPLDDTYIGELIKMINYTDRMVSSTSLCTGVHVVPQNAGGWHMDKDFDNPCFLAGLTMYHRFGEGGKTLTYPRKFIFTSLNRLSRFYIYKIYLIIRIFLRLNS